MKYCWQHLSLFLHLTNTGFSLSSSCPLVINFRRMIQKCRYHQSRPSSWGTSDHPWRMDSNLALPFNFMINFPTTSKQRRRPAINARNPSKSSKADTIFRSTWKMITRPTTADVCMSEPCEKPLNLRTWYRFTTKILLTPWHWFSNLMIRLRKRRQDTGTRSMTRLCRLENTRYDWENWRSWLLELFTWTLWTKWISTMMIHVWPRLSTWIWSFGYGSYNRTSDDNISKGRIGGSVISAAMTGMGQGPI